MSSTDDISFDETETAGEPMSPARRLFLKQVALSSAALVIGFNAQGLLASDESALLNPFVKIDTEGRVTVVVKHFEMGQGTTTGLATLVAEELDADWQAVLFEFAPADPARYQNLFWGSQGTGGSTSIANAYQQYRQAGAAARDLLIRAAAQQWGVTADQVHIEKGVLIYKSGKSAGSRQGHYGQFLEKAKQLTPVEKPTLKRPEHFKLIGDLALPRKDSVEKSQGRARFAMDVTLPKMLYVVIRRPPNFGGTVKALNATPAKEIAGFVDAQILPNRAGVAIYAQHTWAAFKAQAAVQVEWDLSTAEQRSSVEMQQQLKEQIDKPDYQIRPQSTTAVNADVAKAATRIEHEFMFPFLAHAPMEPLNCVIEPTAQGVRLYDGCQAPSFVLGALSQVLGLKPEQIEIKTLYAGGWFGRRATPTGDYQVEAAMAFILKGRKIPIKLVWSREDDIRGGYYRPIAMHKVRVGLNQQGGIQGWSHLISTQSILKGTPLEGFAVKEGVDHLSVEGVGNSLYGLPNFAVGLKDFESRVPVLWWRSVGHTHTAFVMESMIDSIAAKAKRDPIELRLSLLDQKNPQAVRMVGVLNAVKQLSRWQKGDQRGVAAHFSFNTWVAVVADVSVNKQQVHVNKLYMAVDCGIPINPDVIKAQMVGGAGFALGAAIHNEVTFNDQGEVQQTNFPDYAPLRMAEMPEVEVTIIPSQEAPSGVGEPGVPPTAPAVANAIFAQTGIRITELPMTKSGLTFV